MTLLSQIVFIIFLVLRLKTLHPCVMQTESSTNKVSRNHSTEYQTAS